MVCATMDDMKKTAPLSHRLPPDLKEALQRLADADSRSLTNYIELVLKRHVAAEKKRGGHGHG
jgi:predicted transcriptional regulator